MTDGRMNPGVNPSGVDLFSGSYEAFLFDMDGVLTDTASVHAEAWKQSFDEFLKARAKADGSEFVPFDIKSDYPKYVDGKRREDGVRSFLASRGITLPEGEPNDPPTAQTVRGVGNSKNVLLLKVIDEQGVVVYDDSVILIKALKAAGYKVGVVSSSANTVAVLTKVNLLDLFDVRVDGVIAAQMQLPGKPAPDTFAEAAKQLGVGIDRAVVIEDAEAGVAAGHAGPFGLTLGVDRVNHFDELYENGADVVFNDLTLLVPAQ